MVGSSTWRLTNETAARNLQLTTLSYTPKGFEEQSFAQPNIEGMGGGGLESGKLKDYNKNDFLPHPDVACINSSSLSSSLSSTSRNAALVVRNAIKYYGTGNACTSVLKNFNMTVPKGTIYGLLGSSGCGKTTVLSCIVGLRKLNSGVIMVFGRKPGSQGCGVPGSRVGYMPQELALYDNMTIGETISFYGALANLPRYEVNSRLEFLVKLLDLPDQQRRIDCLSCGQKRRVSLALTMVHDPELLILDEPTVGVDPLLRESIWEHLTNLVSTKGTTVIITTHYIEEASRSATVGLMRNGRLLTEDNPQKLLVDHNAQSLNDIVLKLCKNNRFEESYVRHDPITPDTETCIQKEIEANSSDNYHCEYDNRLFSKTSLAKIKALTIKNALLMVRNFWLILLILLNPAIDVCLVNSAMGGDPSHLNFGYVNYELNSSTPCAPESFEYETCILANLSCRLLHSLSKGHTFTLKQYPTDEAAIIGVDEGQIWGFVSFPNGYSDSLFERATEGLNTANNSLDLSNMKVKIDATNRPVAAVILNTLYEAYKTFIRGLLSDCGLNPEFGELPVKILPPTHGALNTDMKEFVAPGILLGVLFFFPYCSGALAVILEKKQGTLSRTQVAGASIFELMISFLLTQTVVLLVQSFSTFFLTTWYFGINVTGSVPLGLSMSVLMGLDGVSMGFLVAAFCNGELEAVILGIGYFLANFIVSGTLWPIQAGPPLMQYFAIFFFPATLPSESVRSIISRGWGFTHANVYPGFVSEFIRISLFWVLTIVIHKASFARR
ncbi:ABC transporter G family member 23 isoform X2 [Folsomia candida]|nr:ABC transporter G family member 23 isoform X2 [Folsomia candida]